MRGAQVKLEDYEFGDAADPAGFARVRFADVLDRTTSKEILLPTPLVHRLVEEKDARRLRRVEEESARFRAEHVPAPTPASAKSQDDEASFIRAFDCGAQCRNPTRRHPVLTSKELARVSQKVSSMRDRDYQRREREVLDKLKSRGPLRIVANPVRRPAKWRNALELLNQCHPHFRAVTNYVARQVALSERSKTPLMIPPLHLWGDPGLGKSCYAYALATALGTTIRRQSMENAQTTALLLGSERHWSTAAPGIVFEEVVLGENANPVFLIEELDKAPKNAGYDPVAPLHSLLEPFTARKARDAALDLEFDASLAIYVATSNDPSRVPGSLRSRFREFHILPATGEDALLAARVVVAGAIADLQIPEFAVPEARWAHKLAHLTPREIHHVVRDAAATAIQAGRFYLTSEDLPPEEAQIASPAPVLH